MSAAMMRRNTGKKSHNAWGRRVQKVEAWNNAAKKGSVKREEKSACDERHVAGERIAVGGEQVGEREAPGVRVRMRCTRPARARRRARGCGLRERRQTGEQRVLALLASATRIHCAAQTAFNQQHCQWRQEPVAEDERRCGSHCKRGSGKWLV